MEGPVRSDCQVSLTLAMSGQLEIRIRVGRQQLEELAEGLYSLFMVSPDLSAHPEFVACLVSLSVVSYSLQPHGL